jgi:hypothetical protein
MLMKKRVLGSEGKPGARQCNAGKHDDDDGSVSSVLVGIYVERFGSR